MSGHFGFFSDCSCGCCNYDAGSDCDDGHCFVAAEVEAPMRSGNSEGLLQNWIDRVVPVVACPFYFCQ